ncbi:Mitochondrial distribution and morphology protein [Sparassis crispa]|uniref:Mitochondrial distribution and morphology protein 12 n=1 Tax=Sparassis crispa TaxID=139825 RepID=A0A401GI63_9APHY|nr:Mitochondrial distribution and morphology protein [Sparassis crispa]GBE81862.1 Mitochondrial distribution and morphology protein [Sparassis crispa]
MSIDLEWQKLDPSLASSLVDVLNKQLASTPRPSFIGPIEVTSFEFGSTIPDVELVDLRDIYRDFLEDDEDADADEDPVKVSQWAEEDGGFEWVPRRATRENGLADDGPAYHLLPPHMRYGRAMAATDMFASTPSLRSPRDIWNPAFTSLADLRSTYPAPSLYASAMSSAPSISRSNPNFKPAQANSQQHSSQDANEKLPESPRPASAPEPPTQPTQPNLQMHLHITWNSNLRLTLTTSLLINYPSPMFMSLPIKLSVTGLLFTGEVVVAYEGARRRVHLCILDELDPYSPLAVGRVKRDTPPAAGTPTDADDDTPGSAMPARTGKPLPIGQRLLPSIYIESEIGQADKHVLKNVTRVERFIQDVIRKTVEEELVFPNFHTLVFGDEDS